MNNYIILCGYPNTCEKCGENITEMYGLDEDDAAPFGQERDCHCEQEGER